MQQHVGFLQTRSHFVDQPLLSDEKNKWYTLLLHILCITLVSASVVVVIVVANSTCNKFWKVFCCTSSVDYYCLSITCP